MTITVYEGKEKHEIPFEEGNTVLDVLQQGGIKSFTAPCGGKGTCKKCTVFVQCDGFSGTCLACMVAAKDQMNIEIAPEVRSSIAEEWEGDVYQPTTGQSGYAVACDNWVISWIRKRRIRRLRST